MYRITACAIFAIVTLFGYARAGSIETGKIESVILNATKDYAVYLPDGYENTDKRYPVLYLLHGASDTYRAWIDKGNVSAIADQEIAAGFALPMIIVMPDAKGEGENNMGKNMGYFNQPDWNYEDHFFREFIPHIESTYRIEKGKGTRAVAGLSMGGGGAAGYALRYPEMFSSVCPLSGALNGMGRPSIHESPVRIVDKATPEQVEAFKSIRWYVDCGDDDFLWKANVDFFTLMKEKGIPLQFRMRDGAHDWQYWQGSLHEVLKFISIGFRDE